MVNHLLTFAATDPHGTAIPIPLRSLTHALTPCVHAKRLLRTIKDVAVILHTGPPCDGAWTAAGTEGAVSDMELNET